MSAEQSIVNSIDREPFWMSNPEWYEMYKIPGEEFPFNVRFRLTDMAPKEAVDSFIQDRNKKQLIDSGLFRKIH